MPASSRRHLAMPCILSSTLHTHFCSGCVLIKACVLCWRRARVARESGEEEGTVSEMVATFAAMRENMRGLMGRMPGELYLSSLLRPALHCEHRLMGGQLLM